MYRIILVTLLLWSLNSQTVEVVDEPPPLPSQTDLQNLLLSEDRQALSSQLIDDVFSRVDLNCKFKIKFIECYLGKLRALIARSKATESQRAQLSSQESEENAENRQKFKDLHNELKAISVELEELEDLRKKLIASDNGNITPQGRDKARQLINKLITPQTPPEERSAFRQVEADFDLEFTKTKQLRKKLQNKKTEVDDLSKLIEMDQEDQEKEMKNQERRALKQQLQKEIKKTEDEIVIVDKNFSRIRLRFKEAFDKIKNKRAELAAEKSQRKKSIKESLSELSKNIVANFLKENEVPRIPAVFLKAEEQEFSCIGVSPVSIAENMNQKVVTTLSPTDFQTFIQFAYEVDAIPNFDHASQAEISLIRHSLFGNGGVNRDFLGQTKCCDADLEVYAGTIQSIDGSAYTIATDDGQEVIVHHSVCSRVYKLNGEEGDRIVLRKSVFDSIEYIADALIYKGDDSL